MAKEDKIQIQDPPIDLAEELRLTKLRLAELEKKMVLGGISEELEPQVLARIRMGASREDAITCSRRQILADKARLEAAAFKVDPKIEKKEDAAAELKARQDQFLQPAMVAAGRTI